jgi:hypothetical protein
MGFIRRRAGGDGFNAPASRKSSIFLNAPLLLACIHSGGQGDYGYFVSVIRFQTAFGGMSISPTFIRLDIGRTNLPSGG